MTDGRYLIMACFDWMPNCLLERDSLVSTLSDQCELFTSKVKFEELIHFQEG